MHLEHVNMTVSDLDRSIAFYSDLLDLSVRWKGDLDGDRRAAHVGDDNCYLALFEATVGGDAGNDYTRPGYNHMGFVVDDLDEAVLRLDQLGATYTPISSYEPGRRLYFNDPDNHEVELVQY